MSEDQGTENTNNIEDENVIEIPIEWYIPDDITGRFATSFIVQNTQREFTLSFFEIQQPVFLGTEEETREYLRTLSSVRAKCVGRIVVMPEFVPELIRVLQERYDLYQHRQNEEAQNDV